MGTPAKHERYPEVTCVCCVVLNLCSQAKRILWAFTEGQQLCVLGGTYVAYKEFFPYAKGEHFCCCFYFLMSLESN